MKNPFDDEPITLTKMRESLFSAVVNDALDSIGMYHQSPRVQIRPMTTNDVLVGRCKTMLWVDTVHLEPEPYKLFLTTVDSCQSDDVVIAAAHGSSSSAIWGELVSTAAHSSGCIGAIVDGGVRDVARVRRMGFPVFGRSHSVCDCLNRMQVVDYDVPVEIDRIQFCPGDLVFADEDGIVVVPQRVEEEVIRLCLDQSECGKCHSRCDS